MDSGPPHERTCRLLENRLEEIALAAERSPGRTRDLEPLLLGAAAATRNAVGLALLTQQEAGEIWASVARRHPGVRLLPGGPQLAA